MKINDATDIRIGTTQASKVYMGTVQVWPPISQYGPMNISGTLNSGALIRFTLNGSLSTKSYITTSSGNGVFSRSNFTPPVINSLYGFWKSDYASGSGDNNLVYITSLNVDFGNNTDQCTDMSLAFQGLKNCTSLTITNLDTSACTNMELMFGQDQGSNVAANKWVTLDLSSFDTSSVTNMNGMFARSKSLQTLNVSNWNMNNVGTNYSNMFLDCDVLYTITMNNVTNSVFNKMTNYSLSKLPTSVSIVRDGVTYRYNSSQDAWV